MSDLASLQREVHDLRRELGFIRSVVLPNLAWQSTQQLEHRECLVSLLGVGPGWLPPTRGWAASPDFLYAIATDALDRRPGTVVECGSGLSSLVLSRCASISGQGHVYSLEHDQDHARRTRRLLEQRDLASFCTVIDAPLTNYTIEDKAFRWYDISPLTVDQIDLLIVDGPPTRNGDERYPAGPILFDLLSDSAAVYLDDASRPGETALFQRWAQQNPSWAASEEYCEKGCKVLRRPDGARAD